MGAIATQANTVYRDFINPGVPASGAYEPEKDLIRALFGLIDSTLGTSLNFGAEVSITGATTLGAGSINRAHVILGAVADYTVTIPTAASAAGNAIALRVDPTATKLFTIASSGGGIDDGATPSIVLWRGEMVVLFSDGSNWIRLFVKRNRFQGYGLRNVNGLAIAGAFSAIALNAAAGDPTGLNLFYSAGSSALVAPRKGIYNFSLNVPVSVVSGTVTSMDLGLGLNGSTTPIAGPATITRFSHPAGGQVRNLVAHYPSVSLNKGDLVAPLIQQTGGVTPTVFAGSGFATYLGMEEV